MLSLFLSGTGGLRGQSTLDDFDPNANDAVNIIVVQPDGRILIGGDFRMLSPNGGAPVSRNHIARLNPDGTVDTDFNPIVNAANTTVYAIALQTDGKIVLAGTTSSETTGKDFAIVRYEADGALDDGFGEGGKVVVSFGNDADTGYAVMIQQDRKIVVGGESFTIADLVEQAKWNIHDGQEATWTLMAASTYLPDDAKWTAKDGTEWTIEQMAKMEAGQDLNGSACGGTHRLYGLVNALNRHLQQGGEVTGGWVDSLLMRGCEVLISIPFLVLAMIAIMVAGPAWAGSPILLILAVGLVYVPRIARMARVAAVEVSSRDYVMAARLRGESSWAIIRHEILPNSVGTLLVEFAIRAGYAPVLIGALGFLGFGIRPPTPEWGLMMSEYRNLIAIAPMTMFGPGLMLASLVVGLNLFTEGLARLIGGKRVGNA